MTRTEERGAATGAVAGPEVVFQPIVDLARGVAAGYEALARFPAYPGEAGPTLCFADAVAHGVGPELDALVVARVLDHRADLPPNCFLTVNVEPASLLRAEVRSALVEGGGLGGVVIELTERRPVPAAQLVPVLDRLRSDGAVIALDDVGAGQAGLQQVLDLRPEILKVDRSLVAGIGHDEARRSMVEMLGAVASRVDAWLVAEGVETDDELRGLVAMGVPLAQGHHLARPGPPWPELRDGVAATLVATPTGSEPLRSLVQHAPTVRLGGTDRRGPFVTDPDLDVMVVVDAAGRPVGVMTAAGAMTGDVRPALRVRTDTSPRDLAQRLSTVADPTVPTLVVDRSGRYQGVVTLARLLAHLGDGAGPG